MTRRRHEVGLEALGRVDERPFGTNSGPYGSLIAACTKYALEKFLTAENRENPAAACYDPEINPAKTPCGSLRGR